MKRGVEMQGARPVGPGLVSALWMLVAVSAAAEGFPVDCPQVLPVSCPPQRDDYQSYLAVSSHLPFEHGHQLGYFQGWIHVASRCFADCIYAALIAD